MSVSHSDSSSGSESRFVAPGGIGRKLRRQVSGDFLNQLQSQGTSGLGTPMGILGPIWQNLFGGGGGDYLGAKSTLQDAISGGGSFGGQGLDAMIGSARNQLLPSTMQGIKEGSSALQAAAGPAGLRFSTDLMGQQGQLAGNMMNQLQQNSLGAALPLFQQQNQIRSQSAQDIFGLIGQLGQQSNPIQMLMSLLGGAQPQLGDKANARSQNSSAAVNVGGG